MQRARGLRQVVGILLLFGWLLAFPAAALAHPLDEYPQSTYITVAPEQIEVELNLTPGVLVAPRLLPEIDTDGDREIADAESRAYAETVLRGVTLQVDGQPLPMALTKIEMPSYLNVQAGYGTIRLFTAATPPAGATGTHQIAFRNSYAPTGSTYQVNTFVDPEGPIALGEQNRDANQQGLTVDYAIDGAPAAEVPVTAPSETATGAAGESNRLLAFFDAPSLSAWELLLALALAGLLGGLHALTPGHGKTLVAAYLVGSRGTVRHAVALGGIVTFTHTASVIVIGLLALVASQYIVPEVLVPILSIFSGLLVMVIGVRLVRERWTAFQRGRGATHAHPHDRVHNHDNDHDHSHEDGHDHPHEIGDSHDHGDGHAHSHLPPAEGLKVGSLVAMGVSGGLIPCPEALGIMVIAVGLNRILLGLGLIVSFSFGLAAVLMIIGILLVRSRSLVERFGSFGGRWSSGLPLGSAVVVTVLGAVISINGILAYLG